MSHPCSTHYMLPMNWHHQKLTNHRLPIQCTKGDFNLISNEAHLGPLWTNIVKTELKSFIRKTYRSKHTFTNLFLHFSFEKWSKWTRTKSSTNQRPDYRGPSSYRPKLLLHENPLEINAFLSIWSRTIFEFIYASTCTLKRMYSHCKVRSYWWLACIHVLNDYTKYIY